MLEQNLQLISQLVTPSSMLRTVGLFEVKKIGILLCVSPDFRTWYEASMNKNFVFRYVVCLNGLSIKRFFFNSFQYFNNATGKHGGQLCKYLKYILFYWGYDWLYWGYLPFD